MDDTALGRAVHGLARWLAYAGGLVLVIVTVVTVVSIIGRSLIPLGLKPIPGDFEVVQAGMLFAILSFLPWCHLVRGHAIVAILTDRFPVRAAAVLEALMDIAMLVVAVFIAWRLGAGMLDKYDNKESTFILHVPLWLSYLTGMVGALLFIVVAAYCVLRSTSNALSPRPQRPLSETAE